MISFTKLLLLLGTCSSIIISTFALYDQDSLVSSFTSYKDFRERVLESNGISLIQFYAPWCGHCQQFAPAFQQIAYLLNGLVTVGAIDASSDGPLKRIANDYGVSGFPTLKLFKPSKTGKGAEVIDLQSRDPNEILNSVMQAAQQTIQERANGAGGAGTGANGSSSSHGGGASNSSVKKLTMANFHESVYENDQVVAVAFVAPWCGHCKQLLPEWEAAAAKLKRSGALLATVDATEEEQLAAQFGVRGYPTIKVFPGGKKNGPGSAIDYNGGRTKEQIVSSILEEVDRSGVPKEIPELINKSVLEDSCSGEGENIICVLVALPHILETGASGRNKYKDTMIAASKAVRGMPFEFIWFEGGNYQGKLENALELTFGFPAVAAYSMEKNVVAVHRNSFTEANLRNFLMGIMGGRTRTYPINTNLAELVVEVEPWDGLDGVPFEEEPLDWMDEF